MSSFFFEVFKLAVGPAEQLEQVMTFEYSCRGRDLTDTTKRSSSRDPSVGGQDPIVLAHHLLVNPPLEGWDQQ